MTDDLDLAERAARAAGEVLMSYFGRAAEGLDMKSSPTDPVSDADREAERTIRELLLGSAPTTAWSARRAAARRPPAAAPGSWTRSTAP